MRKNKLSIVIILFFFISCHNGNMKIEECQGCLFESGSDMIHLTTISEFPENTFINIHELNSADIRITADSIHLLFHPGFEDAEIFAKIDLDRKHNCGSCFVKLFHAEWEQFEIDSESARFVMSKMTNGGLRIGGFFESEIIKKAPGYEKDVCTRNNISFLVTATVDSTLKDIPLIGSNESIKIEKR